MTVERVSWWRRVVALMLVWIVRAGIRVVDLLPERRREMETRVAKIERVARKGRRDGA